MPGIVLTKEQIDVVVDDYLRDMGEHDLSHLLGRLVEYHRNEFDHLKTASLLANIVARKCAIPLTEVKRQIGHMTF